MRDTYCCSADLDLMNLLSNVVSTVAIVKTGLGNVHKLHHGFRGEGVFGKCGDQYKIFESLIQKV